MDVKTNKEYTAMLHEIEGVEREIRAREDQILAEMEQAETLTAEVKREEAAFKEVEEQAPRRGAGPRRARADASRQEAARLAAERDAVAATVPEDAWSSSSASPSCAGRPWPRPQRRHVPALPHEAAARRCTST